MPEGWGLPWLAGGLRPRAHLRGQGWWAGAQQPGPQVHQHRVGEAGGFLPATASATPAAYRQRVSNANRSAASRSDKPSSRCSTITTARIEGGTERRPVGSNRSANSSGGNSRPRSPARNRYTDPAGGAASHQRAPVVGSPGRLRQWSSLLMISSGAAGSWLSITTSAIRVGGRRSGSGAGRGCSVAVSRLGGLGRPEQHTVACTARRVTSI
jgi:hypothetical protein